MKLSNKHLDFSNNNEYNTKIGFIWVIHGGLWLICGDLTLKYVNCL